MADTVNITTNLTDGSSVTSNIADGVTITSSVTESSSINAQVTVGGKGDKGDTGNTGPQGPTGATGSQGPAGTNGLITSITAGTNVTVDSTVPSAPTVAVPGTAFEQVVNKSVNTSLGTSDTLYPSQKAVKTYADTKEPSITAGTTSQYWRGDKSWQTLDKSAVGLGNVDNTSDASKPVSTAQQTALNLKEDTANKSTSTSLGTSNTLFPTQNAVKSYADTGLALKEDVANKSTNTSLGTSNTLYPSQNAVKTYVDTLDAQNAKLTGTQTVAGVKTFSSRPLSSAGTTGGPTELTTLSQVQSLDQNTQIVSISQTSHGFSIGNIVRYNGTSWVKSQADTAANAEVAGIVVTAANANVFGLVIEGYVTGTVSGLTAGTTYFLSPTTAGSYTATEPTTGGQISKPLFIATSATDYIFRNYRGIQIATTGTNSLGFASITSNTSTASTTAAQITGLSVTGTAPGSRTVEVTVLIPQISPASASDVTIGIWEGTVGSGTLIQQQRMSLSTNFNGCFTVIASYTPTSGSKTWNASFLNTGGFTTTLTASSTGPAYISAKTI